MPSASAWPSCTSCAAASGAATSRRSCVLLYKEPLGETAQARLSVMRETEDGFLIAEEDLRLRGEGEVLGTRQSGTPGFQVARIEFHADLLEIARDDARLLLCARPGTAVASAARRCGCCSICSGATRRCGCCAPAEPRRRRIAASGDLASGFCQSFLRPTPWSCFCIPAPTSPAEMISLAASSTLMSSGMIICFQAT